MNEFINNFDSKINDVRKKIIVVIRSLRLVMKKVDIGIVII
jgi:hypothetical protein